MSKIDTCGDMILFLVLPVHLLGRIDRIDGYDGDEQVDLAHI